jgi:formate hydrogenlyase subunit 3/multisubunit Na+/H+ antiporter MnhD subunit
VERIFALPIGLPGQGMQLAVDPLSALFLVILAPQILAVAIGEDRKSPLFWTFVVGLLLTVVAADSFALVFGFELMSAASWLLVLQGDRKPATLYAGIAMFSGACLVPALFLPVGGIAFGLILLGAGAKAGLAPLHAWLPRAHPVPPAGISALMSGGMVKVALYVIIRYGFVVMGAEAQPWWGAALVVAGGASVIIGALRAMLETELKTVLACSTVEHVGLIAVGLGIALRALAAGDAALAALALQGALLLALAHGLFKPLLFLGAGAVKQATGTTSLDWLGGLIRGMPRTGLLVLVGCLGMAALPLGPAFAPEFLLLHAVFGAAATGGIITRIGFEALLAVLGLSAAMALGAAVRIVGIGFLGRPRSLRAAAAGEAPGPVLAGMALLAALCVPMALAPGLVLAALRPVLRELVPGAEPAPLDYAPFPLALLLCGFAGAAYLLLRKFAARGEREVPAWQGGFGKPPVWLPFGDPATQATATGFAEPVFRAIGVSLLGANRADPGERFVLEPLRRLYLKATRIAELVRRATIRQRLAFVFGALVVFLLALGLGQGGEW